MSAHVRRTVRTESNYALDTLTQIAVKGKADLFIVPLSAVDNSWC